MHPLPRIDHSPKACERCDRVEIGQNFRKVGLLRACLGTPLIYVPFFLLMPWMIFSALLVYWHLRLLGAQNLKRFRDFLPDSRSHRYSLKSQIIFTSHSPWFFWVGLRVYWIFNCTLYCPWSVALLEWLTYMTKVVENWWCPFHHSRKDHYADAPIDQSVWHAYPEEVVKLHPEDRDNPIWNKDAPTAPEVANRTVTEPTAADRALPARADAVEPRSEPGGANG